MNAITLLSFTKKPKTSELIFSEIRDVEIENLKETNYVVTMQSGDKINIAHECTTYDTELKLGDYAKIGLSPHKVEFINGGLTGARRVKFSKYRNEV